MDLAGIRTRPEFAVALKRLVDEAVRAGRIENASHLAKKLGLSRAAVSTWTNPNPQRRGTGLPAAAHLYRLLSMLGEQDAQAWMDARERAERHTRGEASPIVPPVSAEAVPAKRPAPGRRRFLLAAGGAAVLLAAVLVVVLVSRQAEGYPLAVAKADGFESCSHRGHLCLFGKEKGAGQMVDLGPVKPGDYFDLWQVPLASPATDHWNDAADSANNRSAYVVCFYDGGRGLGIPWSRDEAASFAYDNWNRADAVLVIDGLPCPASPR